MQDLLHMTAERAIQYLDRLDQQNVLLSSGMLAQLGELGGPLPDAPADEADVLALPAKAGVRFVTSATMVWARVGCRGSNGCYTI